MNIEFVKQLFAEYAKSRPWAQAFDWQSITAAKLNINDSCAVCAMYLAIPDKILIDTDETDGVVFVLFCHEMRHAYQRHSMGLIKYLLKKLFCRGKLEEEAAEVEKDAVDFLFEYNSKFFPAGWRNNNVH